uniref:laccase n=1 Tax=Oryza rufipogon TaxID=4529 RepID=A0A0E0RCQ2_ORYRU
MGSRGCSCWLLSLALLCSLAAAKEQYHEFVIRETTVKRLCKSQSIMTVNGQFPGPTLEIKEGDSLIINLINRGRYNMTLHWHGVRQMRTGWSDGPEYVTQCPVRPGQSYRRAPSGGTPTPPGSAPPSMAPSSSAPAMAPGEWWDMNPVDVVRAATRTGAAPNISDALTVNAQPGDLYSCSSHDTAFFPVTSGETNLLRFINAALNTELFTNLLRFINAALNTELFVSLAGHNMTVVAADASYTKPYTTSLLLLAPGQTTDVLVTFDQPPGRYYLAARAYASAQGVPFDNTTTTAIFDYGAANNASSTAIAMPTLPAYNDTTAATAFTTNLRGLRKAELPSRVDESLFFTVGVGLFNCTNATAQQCGGPNGTRFAASINNVSF